MVAAKKHTKGGSRSKKNLYYHVNTGRNSIEVSGAVKPSVGIREKLSANGFTWAPTTRVWYAKFTKARITFLRKLSGKEPEISF